MEKENKKARDDARRDFNDTVKVNFIDRSSHPVTADGTLI